MSARILPFLHVQSRKQTYGTTADLEVPPDRSATLLLHYNYISLSFLTPVESSVRHAV